MKTTSNIIIYELNNAQKKGDIDSKLLIALNHYSDLYLRYYYRLLCECDRKDVIQNILIKFTKKWKLIDMNRNPISYIIQIIRTQAFAYTRKKIIRQKNIIYESEFQCETDLNYVATTIQYQTRAIRTIDC